MNGSMINYRIKNNEEQTSINDGDSSAMPNTFSSNMSRRRTGQVQVSGNYRQLDVRLMELGGRFLGCTKCGDMWRCAKFAFIYRSMANPMHG